MLDIQIVNPSLIPDGWDLTKALFLEIHPTYPSHFLVSAYDPTYIFYLKDVIGAYRTVSLFNLRQLYKAAEDQGYERIIFISDPTVLFDRLSHLNDPYPFEINTKLYPFQLQGFNWTKDLTSDIINWSTGTGKSVLAVAKAKYLLEQGIVDKVVVACRRRNRINWQRQFERIGGLSSMVVEAPGKATETRRARREEMYQAQIFITNYEKFRMRGKEEEDEEEGETEESSRTPSGDGEEIFMALKKKRVYFIWDEMPIFLKNRKTATYKGALQIVRATEARQTCLSATPIENIPEDIFSVSKILDKTVFGTVTKFRTAYARTRNPFAKWQVTSWDTEKLQEMGIRLAFMTHQADKYNDPEIRKQFPIEHWEDIEIELSPQDRKLYDTIKDDIINEFWDAETNDILSKIFVLQMICNNPLLLNFSDSKLAQEIVTKKPPTDKHCEKLITLRDMLDQIDGKIVVFSMYNSLGATPLCHYISEWGHEVVQYDGTDKQSQEAEDRFREDPDCKVFVSSDKGSDSINLEVGSSVINYDYPWKWTTLIQRVSRIHRATSLAAGISNVFYYNFITVNSIEERKKKIIEKKQAYHQATFGTHIAEQAEALSSLTKKDLWYMISGEEL